MLKYLSGKDLKFILELKDKTLKMMFSTLSVNLNVFQKHDNFFDLQTLKNFRILDEKIEIGYLTMK